MTIVRFPWFQAAMLAAVLSLVAAEFELPGGEEHPAETSSSFSGHDSPAHQCATPPLYTYQVVSVFPHDPAAFTQGLIFADGFFYESTGLHERSSLRKVDAATGSILKQYSLPAHLFGEGLTAFQGRLIQLTWRSHLGLVYDQETFQVLQQFSYATEGWGLTTDGDRLIMSDGSDVLYFLDPHDFREAGRLRVHDHDGPVTGLNELEYVRGEVYANIWLTDRIARVDLRTGCVTGWIDLKGLLLLERRDPAVHVLNGIAYDSAHDRLFVTGKLWPRLFEIRLRPAQQDAK